MPKEEWGTKRLCPESGKRFYDLNRDPVISPYTGNVVEIDTGNKSRPLISEKAKAKPETASDDDSDVVLDDDDDTDMDIGDDVLDDDDDDTSVPLEELADVPADDDES